jgi:hypothetical protein
MARDINKNDSNIKAIYWEEVPKLKDEIDSLKKCQVDLLRLAIIIFGAILSVDAALIKSLQLSSGFYNWVNLLFYILITSIIPISLPYLAWIIIHKCRSIFRIVAYIRLVEGMQSGRINVEIYTGYETIYRQLREHPWLRSRIIPFNTLNIFKRFFENLFKGYKYWTGKAIDNATNAGIIDKEQISRNGLKAKRKEDNKEEIRHEVYMGDYYGKQLFFIELLEILGFLATMIFIFIGIYNGYVNNDFIELCLFGIIGIIMILWMIYHFLLLKRYLKELRYRPFSHDAYFDMWVWAMKKNKGT